MISQLASRIEAYVDAIPPAVSGQGGHKATFAVACALVNGFAIDPTQALRFLQRYNQRCQPPWTEKELIHKVNSAAMSSHAKPRGHLLGDNGSPTASYSPARATPKADPKPSPPVPVCPERTDEFPEAQLNPTIAFLLAAFKSGEGVQIAKAVKHPQEDRDVPEGSGIVYERDALIRLLEKHKGDPNAVFASDRGAYVRINPMRSGCAGKNEDVTLFRHVLVEFDEGGPQEQWEKIIQSGAPVTAVLTSGKKSVHAWVRVDAADAKDFQEKVAQTYAYFQPLGADPANKNSARFSRLPGMRRGSSTQELLAVNIGAASFSQWLVDRAAAGIGSPMPWSDLLAFNREQDAQCVLGDRWLCRGGSLLIVGPTGVGKSSFAFQAAVHWAIGIPFLGVDPGKPRKSLFLQAENDLGDMAEIAQGILRGCNLIREDQPEANAEIAKTLSQNLIVIRDQSHVGIEFVSAAKKLIEKHHPDFFWADPLLSYYGADVKEQKEASTFLRTWLNPISESTGVIWVFLHHTPKPSTDTRNSSASWQHYAYAGLGSVEFAGWARAIIVLIRNHDSEDEFKCVFAKRGYRAKAKDTDGSFSSELYLAHGSDGIYWVQIPKPEKLKDSDQSAVFAHFASSLPDSFFPASASSIIAQATKSLHRGARTLWRSWDKGNGPLAKPFTKSTEIGLYVKSKVCQSLPYND